MLERATEDINVFFQFQRFQKESIKYANSKWIFRNRVFLPF